eukprot:2326788-Pleurochrysis_carterae.AAC.1
MGAEAEASLGDEEELVTRVVGYRWRREQVFLVLDEDDVQIPPFFRGHRKLVEVVGRVIAEDVDRLSEG